MLCLFILSFVCGLGQYIGDLAGFYKDASLMSTEIRFSLVEDVQLI